jgi:GLPGLI family protein
MMRLNIFLLVTLFTSNGAMSQKMANACLVIEYDYKRVPETSPFSIHYNARLTANDSVSIYEIEIINNVVSTSMTTEKGSYKMIVPAENPIFYKNLFNNVLLNKERILMHQFVVQDSLTIFDWELTDNSKRILGYECREASTTFRGRDYVAYFAPAIPSQNGPWKFHGLPGLILEVGTIDKSFQLTATHLEMLPRKIKIANPYSASKIISRAEFETLYKTEYYETNAKSDGDKTFRLSKGAMEIIIQD